MNRSFTIKIFILIILLLIAIFIGVINGSCNIPIAELLRENNRNILSLRILRVFLAIVVGSGLTVSGIALQAILRNPLAEPYLLGISSGAGLGALIAILTGIFTIYLPLAAFTGAILTIILVYNISRQANKVPAQSLILSGVVISIALSGLLIFLISISNSETLHSITWWLWGSLQVYDLRLILIVSVIVFVGITIIYIFSQDLNAISIGEEEAVHLGINTETVKKILFFATSLITASIVCISGVIGFVGLIIPHIMRLIVGPNHRILIPISCIAAAIFMIICDLLSRSLFAPLEIPIGVITSFAGAIIFIVLLKKSQRIK
ncbi:MAG: iron ABC transporter permease [Candidatus Omnitrophota bacterium]